MNPPGSPPDPALEAAACEAARRAGAILLEAFRNPDRLRVREKAAHDYVTELDHAAEAAVISHLTERFPDHGILAEESSPDAPRGAFRWIVDPLDGTTNFIHGVPFFAVSVALQDPLGLAVGVVYDPVHDELFHARRGAGARRNGEPIRVSSVLEMRRALLATGFPFRDLSRVEVYLQALGRVLHAASGVRRAGSAAMDLAYVACGRFDGFFELGLSPWDVAAGALLVREAGGKVTDVAGDPEGFLNSGDIVAAPPALYPGLLELVGEPLRRLSRS